MRRVTIVTLFVGFMCLAIFITAFTMSLTLRPLKRQVIYPPPPPTAAPTRAPTLAPTAAPTTLAPTASPTTAPPTNAPTFEPLGIICPPDINITLGSSLSLEHCGFPTLVGGMEPGCGVPVAFFVDKSIGIVSKKRSPSFSAPNIVPQSFALSGNSTAYTSLVTTDDTYYLTAQETLTGTLYTDSNGVAFYLNGTQGSVHWDQDVYRFVIIENDINGEFVYLHLNTSAVLNNYGSWETFVFPNITGNNPQLGIWPQVYVVAVAAPTNNMCVIDRLAVLNSTLIPVNQTLPSYFCAMSISGNLAGFSQARASWTPLGVRSVSSVNAEVESAGTNSVGAVWMRHHDDELHNGANTPLFDWLDVEHWTNINWTTQDYISLRYVLSITDFNSSYAYCPDPTNGILCIPTPVEGVYLDARRENIMPNLHYTASTNGVQRVTAVFTSNATGLDVANVRWVEMRWQSPSNTLAARFVLAQQGIINDTLDVVPMQRWLPTAFMDTYSSTLVVAYSVSNNDTVWPGVRATSRLQNDPDNQLRDEVSVYVGGSDGSLSNSTVWGPWATLDSAVGRQFIYSGPVTPSTQLNRHLRITGDIIQRTFTGANTCNQTTCEQIITEM